MSIELHMIDLTKGDQKIRYDRNATIEIYKKIKIAGADECGCLYCRNFSILREKAYPEEFKSLLHQLGVDINKENEVFEYGPENNLYLYGGWFCFVGEIIEAGEKLKDTQGFQYWFTQSHPKNDHFRQPSVAIEFLTRIPWRLTELPEK
jgi:hypothetical protein